MRDGLRPVRELPLQAEWIDAPIRCPMRRP